MCGILSTFSMVHADGSGSADEVAEAAARAGLDFVVLTDHGDGTRMPDPPRYRAGVLVIDGPRGAAVHVGDREHERAADAGRIEEPHHIARNKTLLPTKPAHA